MKIEWGQLPPLAYMLDPPLVEYLCPIGVVYNTSTYAVKIQGKKDRRALKLVRLAADHLVAVSEPAPHKFSPVRAPIVVAYTPASICS
jgi:hypothetical protein